MNKQLLCSVSEPDSRINRLSIFLIRCYQVLVSPVLGSHCRFIPTCSNYAIEAFAKYPFFKACRLTCCRLLKCHPLHPGGYDPV
ncbi:MAG: membrane protein insertion efficiency factor YidD [Deltaproteobacteria bacterium]|nr:membrane protein insertion efficiency factor YidD [Deltaproteobacteria bacterium]